MAKDPLLDLDQFFGGITGPQELQVEEIKEEPLPDPDSYERVLARLTEIASRNETFVCINTDEPGVYKVRELRECSPEDFDKWVKQVYPPAIQENKSLSSYQKESDRIKEFYNTVASIHDYLRLSVPGVNNNKL